MAKLEIRTHGTVQVQYRDFAHACLDAIEDMKKAA